MFSNGNWMGFLGVIIPFVIIWIAQSYYERGAKWARPTQYIAGIVFLMFVIYLIKNTN